jgi:hypothetical protein
VAKEDFVSDGRMLQPKHDHLLCLLDRLILLLLVLGFGHLEGIVEVNDFENNAFADASDFDGVPESEARVEEPQLLQLKYALNKAP